MMGYKNMKLISLVENTAPPGLRARHGLAIYIETRLHRLLFDLGPDGTLFENAGKLGVDLAAVDTVVLSHGHFDHGGALGRFLAVNDRAKVYVQEGAFAPHYTRAGLMKISIGLDPALREHPRVVAVRGDLRIDGELLLFTVPQGEKFASPMNGVLLENRGKDPFAHEQDLLITEDETVLLMGCGHRGAVNIMEKAAPWRPDRCVGGFHLYDPVSHRTAPKPLLEGIAAALAAYPDTAFYTCHCTGKKAYGYLRERMPRLGYFQCGDTLFFPENGTEKEEKTE